ncbi:MAG: hypothetical protein HKN41_09155 [Ilumatobacter sp.]|nr:hypothetical protein [Ilumatobacter sp.]
MLTVLVAVAVAPVALTACGGDESDDPVATRRYDIPLAVDDSGDEYRYVASGADPIDIRVGDEVTFELDNTGALPHDLVVVDPGGDTIASTPAAAPGASTTLTVRFDEAGFFRLRCLVGDHLTVHGMQTFIEVTEPAG